MMVVSESRVKDGKKLPLAAEAMAAQKAEDKEADESIIQSQSDENENAVSQCSAKATTSQRKKKSHEAVMKEERRSSILPESKEKPRRHADGAHCEFPS